ncbi:hypothetical protein OC835_003330 [Tilletia horrida]|nr:hypothetical protein OC835_003330 [Tilletia horrida]
MPLFKSSSKKNRDPSPPPGPPSLPSLNLSSSGDSSVANLGLQFSAASIAASQPPAKPSTPTQPSATTAATNASTWSRVSASPSPSPSSPLASPIRRTGGGPPPSAYTFSSPGAARPRTSGSIPDFRQSPNFPSPTGAVGTAVAPSTPSQSKGPHQAGTPVSIVSPRPFTRTAHPPSSFHSPGAGGVSKSASNGSMKARRRAPQGFNILLAGGVSTGKTSFLRTLLHSCDLEACSGNTPEIIEKAKRFGLAPLPGPGGNAASYRSLHVPVRTRRFETLEGIEIAPSRLVTYLEENAGTGISNSSMSASAAAAARTGSLRRTGSVSGFSIGGNSLSSSASRVLLSVTDTPGLPYLHPDSSIEVEKGVLSLLGQLESKYASTLEQESRVQRKPQSDPHIHLCVYFVDPLTMLEEPSAASKARAAEKAKQKSERDHKRLQRLQDKEDRRRAKEQRKTARKAALEAKAKAAAEKKQADAEATAAGGVTADGEQAELEAESGAQDDEDLEEEDEEEEPEEDAEDEQEDDEDDEDDDDDDPPLLSIRPLELSVLKRLATRVNVLPVIGKADLLTDQRLEQVKDAIKRGLAEAKISLGPFSERFKSEDDETEDDEERVGDSSRAARRRAKRSAAAQVEQDDEDDDEEEDEGAEPVKVIRLRSRRDSNLSNATSSAAGAFAAGPDSESGSVAHGLSPAFGNAPALKKQVAQMVPFALISPEPPRLPAASNASNSQSSLKKGSTSSSSALISDAAAAADAESSSMPSLTRKYRWGVIHVLNPAHCDFSPLRTCLLQTHVEDLREATNRKYEAYRSEMLQAIRGRSGGGGSASTGSNGYARLNGYGGGGSSVGAGAGRASLLGGGVGAISADSGGAYGPKSSSRGARMLANAKRAENMQPEARRIPA